MDLGPVTRAILRVCGTVTVDEHNAVARSALSVRVCPPRARHAHVSAVQVGRLLHNMGYVKPDPASGNKKNSVNWLQLQDDCKSGVFWATAAQQGLNVEDALIRDDEGSAWSTMSLLPMDVRGFRTFEGLHLKLVFCTVVAARLGLDHALTLDRVVRYAVGEIRQNEKLWQVRWPCPFRALAVSYRPLAAAGDFEVAERKGRQA